MHGPPTSSIVLIRPARVAGLTPAGRTEARPKRLRSLSVFANLGGCESACEASYAHDCSRYVTGDIASNRRSKSSAVAAGRKPRESEAEVEQQPAGFSLPYPLSRRSTPPAQRRRAPSVPRGSALTESPSERSPASRRYESPGKRLSAGKDTRALGPGSLSPGREMRCSSGLPRPELRFPKCGSNRCARSNASPLRYSSPRAPGRWKK